MKEPDLIIIIINQGHKESNTNLGRPNITAKNFALLINSEELCKCISEKTRLTQGGSHEV